MWWRLVRLPVWVLSELTIPYLKVGGKLLALKANNAPEELIEAKECPQPPLEWEQPRYALPNGDPRYITVVEKRNPQTNIHVRLACQTSALLNNLQNQSSFSHFRLGKLSQNELTRISGLKIVYKINLALSLLGKIRLQNEFFCYTILAKVFNVILWGDEGAIYINF